MLYVTFSHLRSKAQTLLWYITDVPPLWLQQIFTPFQVNKNKILLSTTLECNYLLLLLHSICGFTMYFEFTMYFWIFFIILHKEDCCS